MDRVIPWSPVVTKRRVWQRKVGMPWSGGEGAAGPAAEGEHAISLKNKDAS